MIYKVINYSNMDIDNIFVLDLEVWLMFFLRPDFGAT